MGAALTQAPGALPRRRLARRHLRHAARRDLPERRVQHDRVRHGEGPGAVPGALRLFALPPRPERHALSGRPHADGRERPARRPDAVAQDDRAPSGGGPEGTFLLRTSGSTGHGGIGASVSDVVSLATDVDAFVLSSLGVPLASKRWREAAATRSAATYEQDVTENGRRRRPCEGELEEAIRLEKGERRDGQSGDRVSRVPKSRGKEKENGHQIDEVVEPDGPRADGHRDEAEESSASGGEVLFHATNASHARRAPAWNALPASAPHDGSSPAFQSR